MPLTPTGLPARMRPVAAALPAGIVMMLLSSFLFGLIFGSFLNVVIHRLKTRQNVIFGGSSCPKCQTKLKWHDLVPLLSFIYLRGRCRYCRKKISRQYPIVEILSGLIWAGVFYQNFNNSQFSILNFQSIFNFQFLNAGYEIFILSVFLIVAVYDFKWKIIPDKAVYPAIAVSFFYNAFSAFKFQNETMEIFIYPLLAAVIAFLFFFLIYYFSKGNAMGFGDVKLAFLIGLFLPPFSVFFAFTLAFIIGAVFGIILMLFGKKTLKSQIAFAPFLVLGAVIVFFFQNFIDLLIF
ncbi:prepilin peptidase [Candidatus Azambacteria bacterium]|nr:prepilin peptidase [Candidatus Azambacteria bacterium]